MHDWMHNSIRDWYPGLDPEVGSSLEYKYSVTQSPSGDYIYVKWWAGWLVFSSLAVKALSVYKHGFLAPISAGAHVFLSCHFWLNQFDHLLFLCPSLAIGPSSPKRQAILAQIPLVA